MTTTTAPNTFVQRLLGAAALDAPVYEEIENDSRATLQASVVVILSSLAAGIGATGLLAPGGPARHISAGSILSLSVVALLGWAAWAFVTFEIGYRLMPEPQTRANPSQLLRTIGFATTPGLLRIFGVFPEAAYPAFVISSIWTIAAMVVAVRQALDYTSTARALAVCLFGFALAASMVFLIGTLFGPTLY